VEGPPWAAGLLAAPPLLSTILKTEVSWRGFLGSEKNPRLAPWPQQADCLEGSEWLPHSLVADWSPLSDAPGMPACPSGGSGRRHAAQPPGAADRSVRMLYESTMLRSYHYHAKQVPSTEPPHIAREHTFEAAVSPAGRRAAREEQFDVRHTVGEGAPWGAFAASVSGVTPTRESSAEKNSGGKRGMNRIAG